MTHTITDLEDRFSAAPHDFTFGSPARKVQNLRAQLSEVLQLGVKLKASQTMIPIIDILSDRHPKFAVVLHQYTNGGQTPNDCAITLEQMFSDIEETSSNIERAVGSEIWQAQAHAYSASGYRSSWQAYANDQTCADDQAYADNQDIQEYTDDQAYEDQEYTDDQAYANKQEYADEQAHADEQDDDQSSGNTCDAEGCDAKSEWYKFCYECHQKGIEQGFLVCTDGYKQTIRRRNSKTKDKTEVKEAHNYGFNSKQIEGLSALGQHLAAQIQDSANLGGVQAHQVDPFKAPTMTQGLSDGQLLFKRVGEVQQADAKRAKYKDFFSELSQYE
jgi:hypothetical protein